MCALMCFCGVVELRLLHCTFMRAAHDAKLLLSFTRLYSFCEGAKQRGKREAEGGRGERGGDGGRGEHRWRGGGRGRGGGGIGAERWLREGSLSCRDQLSDLSTEWLPWLSLQGEKKSHNDMEWGLQVGGLTSIFPIAYGMSKFVSGVLGARTSPTVMLSGGLIATGIINVLFGLGSSMSWFLSFWAFNGILQVRQYLLLASIIAAARMSFET